MGGEIKPEQAQRRAAMASGGTESSPYGRRQRTWHVAPRKTKAERG